MEKTSKSYTEKKTFYPFSQMGKNVFKNIMAKKITYFYRWKKNWITKNRPGYKGINNISGSPHELLHNFLHPHLQAYEADAVAPPQPEQVQQVPVRLLQNHLLAVEHRRLARHAAAIL